jgi:hypothetical protein
MQRTLLLARTFFGRFFESDLLPPGVPQAQFVIWSLALLATPGLLMPMRFAGALLHAGGNSEGLLRMLLLQRLLFITLTMTAIGMVALVIWDGVFPDRRDARILSPLPVRGRVLIAARLLALAGLCGLFMVAVNAIPTVIYGPLMGAFGGATNPIRGAAAHFLATTAAGVFTFTALISLQGIVLNLGGRKATDRLSFLMQMCFVLLLLQMIFFMPHVASALPTDLRRGWVLALPSVWFLGLYDVLGGRPAPGAPWLAAVALAATATTVACSVGLFVATSARLTRRALESRESEQRSQAMVRAAAAVTRAFCRHPVSRATFEFTLRTLARSRSHRLLMSAYVGIALAFVASGIVPLLIRRGLAAFAAPSLETLVPPLMLSFFTLVGFRVALSIPVEPRANWAVRISEPRERATAISGVRAAMLVVGVAPSVFLAALSGALLWGGREAVLHAFVCAAMGVLLVEILLLGLAKVPFTCSYFPGKSKIGTLWPLYLTGFMTYTFTPAELEIALLKSFRPSALVIFVALTLGGALFLALRRRRRLDGLSGFVFQEEDPDLLFRGFDLSEGFAAAPKDARYLR